MKFLGIIPARYASTRFPGKPLALLDNHSVIWHVYHRASQVIECVVATDDSRIYDEVKSFNGNVVMTSTSHRTGTDRCLEAYNNYDIEADVVINIQGDEPFIAPSQLSLLMQCFEKPNVDIATLIKPYDSNTTFDALSNPNTPKVIIAPDGHALYFSRSVIPYLRGVEPSQWATQRTYYKHIGIYAYRAEVLKHITAMAQTPLELSESLEQLRWIENGLTIQTAITDSETIGIDTLADLETAKQFLLHHHQ